jgi:hypothetical protein
MITALIPLVCFAIGCRLVSIYRLQLDTLLEEVPCVDRY